MTQSSDDIWMRIRAAQHLNGLDFVFDVNRLDSAGDLQYFYGTVNYRWRQFNAEIMFHAYFHQTSKERSALSNK
jgi:hypothetical protein